MYQLIGSKHRSNSTVFYTEEEAQWFRKEGCGIMVLKGSPVKPGACRGKAIPEAFSKTGEALVSIDGKHAVIL